MDTFLWALTSLERKVQTASACPLQLWACYLFV